MVCIDTLKKMVCMDTPEEYDLYHVWIFLKNMVYMDTPEE